ncbi:amino acid transporter [Coniophora puteana RWD-64-598 SS2]|uniref:Amino acid transporter n=1 Tax=Coniophora puteana (strain RWD-64-598) TaxID=741705 RepID=A0A5M3MD01_CONPW|nr:amino acid transporter [Coniophora puteana RWD-64-598 SS2]EIW76916.1 amino acid transporter [Coniophora puteana RWD-64-598 SS2]
MGLPETGSSDQAATEGLQQLGYKQEMTRSRGLAHILFMTLAIMAVPYGLAAPIATSLVAGGPAVMIWGWILVAVLTQTLALSLAEICSKYPTSAGAYYWCYRLASPQRRLVISWINGWLTMVGVWTIALSVTFGTAQLVVAGAGIYLPNWVATPWQTYLIFLAVTAVACFFCLFLNRLLPSIDILCAIWTALGIIVILICLSSKAAAGRHSAAYALGQYDASASGWTPGWSFFIGLLPVSYTFSAIGMVASMAEEVHNPSHILPQAITWSIPIGAIWGIIFLLPITFTLPDVATLISVSSGQPVGVMFTLAMGSQGGGFGLWFIIFGIGMFCAISISCAASRATWAFARDKALPLHTYFSHVNTRLDDVPVNAYILSTAIQVLLGLIYLGSSAAFNAFVGVAVMCLGASYAMPVAISLLNGRKDVHDAPFSLGKWGNVVNAIAVLWIMFAIVLFSMPAVIPVTQSSMNYASVVFVGFGLFSAVWYMIDGRHHYTGPPVPEVTEMKQTPSEGGSTDE